MGKGSLRWCLPEDPLGVLPELSKEGLPEAKKEADITAINKIIVDLFVCR